MGEFNYTSDAYRKEKAKKYQQSRERRKAISAGISLASAVALPLMVWRALVAKNPTGLGSGITRWMKRHVSKLNYADAIFMGRWQIFYQALFNYEIPKLMAARDSHEFREDLVELGIFNLFYFVGDAAISGWLAKRLNRKKSGQLLGVDLTKPFRWMGKDIRQAKPFGQMYREVGKNAQHPAYKAARKVFFTGLLGSSIGLSLFTLANYAYTRYKATQEQRVFQQKQIQPLLRLMSAPLPARA